MSKKVEVQEIHLDGGKATGAVVRTMIDRAIQQAFESDAAKLIIAGFLEGRKLEGDWLLSVRSVGEIYLSRKHAEPAVVEPAVARAANRRARRAAGLVKEAREKK